MISAMSSALGSMAKRLSACSVELEKALYAYTSVLLQRRQSTVMSNEAHLPLSAQVHKACALGRVILTNNKTSLGDGLEGGTSSDKGSVDLSPGRYTTSPYVRPKGRH